MNKISQIVLPSSGIGELNPMPDIRNVGYIHAGFEVKPSLSADERKFLGQGMIDTLIPYKLQDNYSRDKVDTAYETVVLENDKLVATFLPQFGARLWSLYDKVHKKNLLYTNSVLQPCNFALRNAWFSGGVEFNLGIKGHSPLTCSPMFTELIGDDAVRFYEFERIRGIAYSITAYLPDGAETLYIRVRVENTSNVEKYMYWWSNIAFPEKQETRVIVPAHDAIHCLYQENHYVVDKEDVPISNGVDVSYSMNLGPSSDYFYKIPEKNRKWIVAVHPDGEGLLHYSDSFLKGRKLFLWGKNVGGRHWNEFLSVKDEAYIEIQAGILNTQLEHIPMPAHTVWEWTEGYTFINGADAKLYGDWDGAIKKVEETLDKLIKRNVAVAPEMLGKMEIIGDVKQVFAASNWGALENKIRVKYGEQLISDTLAFPYVSNEETDGFNRLIENGYLPKISVDDIPLAYVNGERWYEILKASLVNEKAQHWYTYLQLGVTAISLNLIQEAIKHFEKSIELAPSLWAYRNLAMIYLNDLGEKDKAFEYLSLAYNTAIAKSTYSFIKEYANALVNNGKDEEWIKIYNSLCPEFKNMGRLLVYYAFALLHTGKYYEASKIITADFVLNDVKEGELSISKLWQDVYTEICKIEYSVDETEARKIADEKYPLPYALDFRMHD